MPFFPYQRVSDFFEAEGDFAENLDFEPDALDQQREDAQQEAWEREQEMVEKEQADFYDEDPCCLLYRQTYLEDHEYGCPRRIAKDRV